MAKIHRGLRFVRHDLFFGISQLARSDDLYADKRMEDFEVTIIVIRGDEKREEKLTRRRYKYGNEILIFSMKLQTILYIYIYEGYEEL